MFKFTIRLAMVFGWVFLPNVATAEIDYDVFVLSIGSGDYVDAIDSNDFAFADNDAAYIGARDIARMFRDGGARHVIQLLGRDGEHISIEDIESTVDDIIALSRTSSNPFLVVYASGHGFSESFGFNLFLAPGDLLIPKEVIEADGRQISNVVDVVGVSERAPTVLSLKEKLEEAGTPFLLIMDTCYETDGQLDLSGLRNLSDALSRLAEDTSDIIRFMNLPRGPYPVVFSAPPGMLAQAVKDPNSPNKSFAPMARLMLLAAEKAKMRGVPLDSFSLVQAMTSRDIVTEQLEGVTWFNGSFAQGSILDPDAAEQASMDQRRGTSYSAQRCCEAARTNNDTEDKGGVGVFGKVDFRPDGKDFVTGGQSFVAEFKEDEVTLWEIAPNTVSIDVALADGRSFSVAVKTPNPRFARGPLLQAQRHAFADEERPGLTITLEGNGCNEIDGAVDVTNVDYDASQVLQLLAFDVRQKCDDGPGVLTGSVVLNFVRP